LFQRFHSSIGGNGQLSYEAISQRSYCQ